MIEFSNIVCPRSFLTASPSLFNLFSVSFLNSLIRSRSNITWSCISGVSCCLFSFKLAEIDVLAFSRFSSDEASLIKLPVIPPGLKACFCADVSFPVFIALLAFIINLATSSAVLNSNLPSTCFSLKPAATIAALKTLSNICLSS